MQKSDNDSQSNQRKTNGLCIRAVRFLIYTRLTFRQYCQVTTSPELKKTSNRLISM